MELTGDGALPQISSAEKIRPNAGIFGNQKDSVAQEEYKSYLNKEHDDQKIIRDINSKIKQNIEKGKVAANA